MSSLGRRHPPVNSPSFSLRHALCRCRRMGPLRLFRRKVSPSACREFPMQARRRRMGFDTRVKSERVARYRRAPNAAFVDRWQVEGAMMSNGPIALLVRCRYRNPGSPLSGPTRARSSLRALPPQHPRRCRTASAQADVDHLDSERERHREVDVALRHVVSKPSAISVIPTRTETTAPAS